MVVLPLDVTVNKSPVWAEKSRAVPSGLYQTKKSPGAAVVGQEVSVRRKKPTAAPEPLTVNPPEKLDAG
jgi:hypothetical protein